MHMQWSCFYVTITPIPAQPVLALHDDKVRVVARKRARAHAYAARSACGFA